MSNYNKTTSLSPREQELLGKFSIHELLDHILQRELESISYYNTLDKPLFSSEINSMRCHKEIVKELKKFRVRFDELNQ